MSFSMDCRLVVLVPRRVADFLVGATEIVTSVSSVHAEEFPQRPSPTNASLVLKSCAVCTATHRTPISREDLCHAMVLLNLELGSG